MLRFRDMENMPQNRQPEHETVDEMIKQTNKQSLDKRPVFLSDLKVASTLEDIRTAVEKYAVEDGVNKVVMNYMEGAYSAQNKTEGPEDLSEILTALENMEKNKPANYEEVQEQIFNYAIVTRIVEILDLK